MVRSSDLASSSRYPSWYAMESSELDRGSQIAVGGGSIGFGGGGGGDGEVHDDDDVVVVCCSLLLHDDDDGRAAERRATRCDAIDLVALRRSVARRSSLLVRNC